MLADSGFKLSRLSHIGRSSLNCDVNDALQRCFTAAASERVDVVLSRVPPAWNRPLTPIAIFYCCPSGTAMSGIVASEVSTVPAAGYFGGRPGLVGFPGCTLWAELGSPQKANTQIVITRSGTLLLLIFIVSVLLYFRSAKSGTFHLTDKQRISAQRITTRRCICLACNCPSGQASFSCGSRQTRRQL